MGKIIFHNIFTKVIYDYVLTNSTKNRIHERLFGSVIALPAVNVESKCILKDRYQRITLFYEVVESKTKTVQILGYQFGNSDKLTGNKKAHFVTLNNILQSTDER